MIGCAPASAECPDHSQPTGQYALKDIIHHQDDPDATRSINLGFLLQALQDKKDEIQALQAKARSEEEAEEKARKANDVSQGRD